MDKETGRQLFHILIGIGALGGLIFLGRGFMIAAIFSTIIFGLLLMNRRLLGAKIPLIQWFEERFERPDAPLPGWGSACYATGALIPLTFLHEPAEIAAVLFILGIGDGISTLVGSRGRIRMPYNRKKTAEGFVALIVASLPAYKFIGPSFVPLAFVGAVAESLPGEDNLTIPILCTAFLLVF